MTTSSPGSTAERFALSPVSSGRRSGLLAERDRLLAQIAKKKAAVERAGITAARRADELSKKVDALDRKHETLVAEIQSLFDDLLAEGRLSSRARKEVTRVYRMLLDDGVLRTDEDDEDASASPPWDHPHDGHDAHGGGDGSSREVASAAPRGTEEGRDSLRSVFRRLAMALHPDRAEESDREERTELMKEVTRAYQDGDFAGLLHLEQRWNARVVEPQEADDEERRCLELERDNRELRTQLTALNRELRKLQRPVRQSPLGIPLDMMLDAAASELDDLEELRDFIASFRDGKISLARFVEGPEPSHDLVGEEDLAGILDALERSVRPPTPRKSRARKG